MAGKAKAASKKELKKQEERDIIKAIKACRIQGDIHLTPRKIDIESLDFDDEHINKDHERNITREQAESFIKKAKISTTVWKGTFERYYSEDGATYVDLQKNSIRTAYDKERFGQDVIDLMEVLKKYGR